MNCGTFSSGGGCGAREQARICDSCWSAPSTVYCRADLAYLCGGCDADIHSANPLARRHLRLPVLHHDGNGIEAKADEEWLLPNPGKSTNGFLFGGEVDEYLDLVAYNSGAENQNLEHGHCEQKHEKIEENECLVPIQYLVPNTQQQQQRFHMEVELEASNAGYSYNTSSLNHNVSPSMEVGVVPDTTVTDIAKSRPYKGTVGLFSGPQISVPPQFTPMDREARVLRYREKRKTRKFEKTIRYASRKAYAETRPRIKGRFAKRSDAELEVDHMFLTSAMSDGGYRIVPSFQCL